MAFYFAQSSYEDAAVLILGIGYDRTSSFLPGTRFAPDRIREAVENIETYSPYQKADLSSVKIVDLGNLSIENPSPDDFFKDVSGFIKTHLANKKKILAIGGEHTISIPLISAYKSFYPNLVVLQFDAHSDLRNEYLKEKLCHATVGKRTMEIVGKNSLYQFGVRSLTKECLKENKKLYLFEILKPLKKIRPKLLGKPIYLTIDLDVLDLSVMPAVSTPEPGGVSYKELISALALLSSLKVVGADIVEYNPLAFESLAYASIAASLVRETILMLVSPIKK